MAEEEQNTSAKAPWWFTGIRTPRTAAFIGVVWLILALAGVGQLALADESILRWLSGLQVISGLLLSVLYMCSAAYEKGVRSGARRIDARE